MERLTIKVNGTYEIKGIEDIPCADVCERNHGCETCEIHKAVEKLATYENLEEKLAKKFAGCIDMKTILDSFCAFYDMQETNEELAQCALLTNEDVLKYRQLKDAEEHGLLLRLPCKVGEPIYYILGIPQKTPCVVNESVFELSDLDRIGKDLFLTQEEAEQALARMEGENE